MNPKPHLRACTFFKTESILGFHLITYQNPRTSHKSVFALIHFGKKSHGIKNKCISFILKFERSYVFVLVTLEKACCRWFLDLKK
jgi:hypothetical protein